MSSTRDIKKRIANVSSVEQIIKAMDMVASTKLIRARESLDGIRPIYLNLKRIVTELGKQMENAEHKFFKERTDTKNTLYVVLTSDRGLSGSYNSNILSKALKHMNKGKNEKLIVVGTKGIDFFKREGKDIIRSVYDISDDNVFYGTENMAQNIHDVFLSDEVDIEEVYLVYTHFENVLTLEPKIEKLLPVEMDESDENYITDIKFEPGTDNFIDHVVPLYLHMSLFRAFSEAHTSEQAARMVSMDAAGKNANDLVEDLNRVYNRKRQAEITQELSEIVGSAESMKKGGTDDY
ncbi:ATP synthase F1 subunit gamma [Alkalibacterium sp. s-m-28]